MVQKLTTNFIRFYKPLLAESLAFCGFASRTVSLFPISSIKLVSILTSYLGPIYCSERQRVIQSILGLCDTPEMRHFHTTTILADMVNNESSWYGAINYVKCNSVRSSSFLSKIKTTITIFIEWALPQLAILANFPLTIKSFKFLFGNINHVAHYTPYSALKQYV